MTSQNLRGNGDTPTSPGDSSTPSSSRRASTADSGSGVAPDAVPSLSASGAKLDESEKDRRLVSHEDGSYEWVPATDYRVAEVRLLHDAGSVGDKSRNLLIRGDALHGLTSLSELEPYAGRYLGKVKVATDLLTDAADEIRHLRTSTEGPTRACPTCGKSGADTITQDFDSGALEADCGDPFHDESSTEGPTRADRDDIVRLTEIRNDWQRKPSRYRDDANLLTRILAALTREAESVRAEATLAAIRAHAGTIWDAHDCKTAAVTYFDGEDAGRNHALTRDESSTEGGARFGEENRDQASIVGARLREIANEGYARLTEYSDQSAHDYVELMDRAATLLMLASRPEGAGEARVEPFDRRAADAMADAIDAAVRSGQISSRSPIADARLEYGDPRPAPDTPTEESRGEPGSDVLPPNQYGISYGIGTGPVPTRADATEEEGT